jgi:hypothetical protein
VACPGFGGEHAADHDIARSRGTGRRDFAFLHRSLELAFEVGRQIVADRNDGRQMRRAAPQPLQRLDLLGILGDEPVQQYSLTIDLDFKLGASPAP